MDCEDTRIRGKESRTILPKIDRNMIMRLLKAIIIAACSVYACGMIEDSQEIPEPGIYTSLDGRNGYESRLTISKKEKGYNIQLDEYANNEETASCIIEASGKKSSYGIWVEVPAYGPRLPIIIRKRNGALEILLKGSDDPKKTFTYCLSDRSPVGLYQRKTELLDSRTE